MGSPDSMRGSEGAERQTFNLTLCIIRGRGVEIRNGAWGLWSWSEGILDKSNREACIQAAWDWINANNPDDSIVNLKVVDL